MDNRSEEARNIGQRLRKASLKVTRPRLLVLGLLHELGGHHTVDELVEELHKRNTPLPRASVYNAIGTLVSHGLVMMADAGPGPALYEEFTNGSCCCKTITSCRRWPGSAVNGCRSGVCMPK